MQDQSGLAAIVDDPFTDRARKNGKRRRRRGADAARRFGAGLSHDARTPLTVIEEYASLLREGAVGTINTEQMRLLEVIADRAADLGGMIDNALDAGKLAEGTFPVWRGRRRMCDILARIRPRLVRKASLQEVGLRIDVPDNLPDLYCDDETVGRAIANIAISAISFSRERSGISISARFNEPYKEVVIEVAVEGQGAGRDAVAAAYRSLDTAASRDIKSVGGFFRELSVARDFIDLNLGELEVATGPRGSTTWRISVPIADPIEVLDRHLTRLSRRRKGPVPVSLLTAVAEDPSDEESSHDVGNFLNSLAGRRGLTFQTGPGRWLLAQVQRQIDMQRLFERTEEGREAINQKRLGPPLPKIALTSLGSWFVPDDVARIFETLRDALESELPVNG
jgi:nitrogen-specific signal transduction histidine kinase